MLLSDSENNRLTKLVLKEWHARLFGSFHIVFDYVTNDLSFGLTQHDGFFVAESTTHVPTKSQSLSFYGFCLFVQTFQVLNHLLTVQSQKP